MHRTEGKTIKASTSQVSLQQALINSLRCSHRWLEPCFQSLLSIGKYIISFKCTTFLAAAMGMGVGAFLCYSIPSNKQLLKTVNVPLPSKAINKVLELVTGSRVRA